MVTTLFNSGCDQITATLTVAAIAATLAVVTATLAVVTRHPGGCLFQLPPPLQLLPWRLSVLTTDTLAMLLSVTDTFGPGPDHPRRRLTSCRLTAGWRHLFTMSLAGWQLSPARWQVLLTGWQLLPATLAGVLDRIQWWCKYIVGWLVDGWCHDCLKEIELKWVEDNFCWWKNKL